MNKLVQSYWYTLIWRLYYNNMIISYKALANKIKTLQIKIKILRVLILLANALYTIMGAFSQMLWGY